MILDIIIILTILLCVIMGYKKGLIEVAFRLISFLIAIILSLMLYVPVSNYIIENTNIDEQIKTIIVNNINPEEVESEEKETSKEVPKIITDYINQTFTEVADTAKDNVTEIVATNLSITAIKILTLILLFIVIRIMLTIVKFITNLISKLPIINSANKLRRNNIWNFRRIIYSLFSISTSNGNICNYRKYKYINIYKRIYYRKNYV